MNKKISEKADVGVIVGRFQVHELHHGHIDLIETVYKNHSKIIIFLGLSPIFGSKFNPLDFEMRKQMILKHFPDINVLYIKDVECDDVWSNQLDNNISDIISPNATVTLYGSRDSFINYYTGKFQTKELKQEIFISGTEIRKNISKKVKNTEEFRAGVIWAACNQKDKVIQTITISIIDDINKKILLIKKNGDNKYSFININSCPNDLSFEEEIKKEAKRLINLNISNIEYIKSLKINDWQYKMEKDCLKTIFFKSTEFDGNILLSDCISEVKWFDMSMFNDNTIKEHLTTSQHCLISSYKG